VWKKREPLEDSRPPSLPATASHNQPQPASQPDPPSPLDTGYHGQPRHICRKERTLRVLEGNEFEFCPCPGSTKGRAPWPKDVNGMNSNRPGKRYYVVPEICAWNPGQDPRLYPGSLPSACLANVLPFADLVKTLLTSKCSSGTGSLTLDHSKSQVHRREQSFK
jgi:hypothetical protein